MTIRLYKCPNEKCNRTYTLDLRGCTRTPTCRGCGCPKPLRRIGPRQPRYAGGGPRGYQPIPDHHTRLSNRFLRNAGLAPRPKEDLK